VKYDTIIIGAGLSGLAAGIRLAYFDQSVCILERHTTIGGLNSFYRLNGRDYDVGLHAMTNFAQPGTKTGPLSKLLRQLRLTWDDFNLSPQIESSVNFPDCVLRFNNSFDFFLTQINTAFPEEFDNFQRFLKYLDGFNELNLEQKTLSARKVLGEYIKEPLLIEMLLCPLMFYGSAKAHDMDFSQFVIMFKSIFYEGFCRPVEGVRLILKKLVRKFKSLGGDLKLRAGVQSISVDGSRAVGVTLDDGTELEADRILSSAGSVETMRLCPEQSSTAEPPKPGEISFVETIATLDCEPAELGNSRTIVFYNNSDSFEYRPPTGPVDLTSGIICSPNNFEYSEPLNEGSVRITALANPDYWLNLPEGEYLSEKERWNDEIVEAAIKHVPDFRKHVIAHDMFTPRTIKKFTGHVNGCVYGAPEKNLDGTTGIQNLYLCGTDQGFLGIVGSMLSGISMANLHILR